MRVTKTKTLTIPGAYIITKADKSDPHVVVRASTNKFLGVIGDMAEYGFRHIPEKYYSNNIPKIEYLDEEDRKIIGTDLPVLVAIEKVMVPTLSSSDTTPPDPLLPNYFGTVMQDNNTVLLAIMPPGYTTMYIFDGPDVDLTGEMYREASPAVNVETSSGEEGILNTSLALGSGNDSSGEEDESENLSGGTDEEVDPTIVGEGTGSNTEGSNSGTDSGHEHQSVQPSVDDPSIDRDDRTHAVDSVTDSAAITITSSGDEASYYRLIAFTIYPEGKGEVDINYVQLGYKTSENPYRNLSKYLLRKDFSGAISKYENNSGFLYDLANGSIVGSVDENLESSLLPKTETYSYTKEYKKGDKVLFGKNGDIWTYTGNSPGVGHIPGFSVGKWTKSNTRGGRFNLKIKYEDNYYYYPCWIDGIIIVVEGNFTEGAFPTVGKLVIEGSGLGSLKLKFSIVNNGPIHYSYYRLVSASGETWSKEWFDGVRSFITNNTLSVTYVIHDEENNQLENEG